jgi:hypothetical protein
MCILPNAPRVNLESRSALPKLEFKTVCAKDGFLKLNKLEPGDLVFSDQHESQLKGCNFMNRGHSLSSQKFRGGTLFCDASSGEVSVVHQVGLAGTKTVQAKLQFEKEAAAVGVCVKNCCTDNGVRASKEFCAKLISKGHPWGCPICLLQPRLQDGGVVA